MIGKNYLSQKGKERAPLGSHGAMADVDREPHVVD
jgi:hypothetical protein